MVLVCMSDSDAPSQSRTTRGHKAPDWVLRWLPGYQPEALKRIEEDE